MSKPVSGGHRLDHLGDGFGLGALRHHQINADRRGHAGFLQQRPGLGDVALADRIGFLIVGMVRVDPLVTRLEFAVEHHLIDRLAIDRQIKRLPHLGGLAQRTLGLVLADIERDALIAELDRGREFQALVRAHVLDVGRQHALDQISPPDFRLASRTVASTIGRTPRGR